MSLSHRVTSPGGTYRGSKVKEAHCCVSHCQVNNRVITIRRESHPPTNPPSSNVIKVDVLCDIRLNLLILFYLNNNPS